MSEISFARQRELAGSLVRLRPIRDDDLDALWDMLNDPESRRLTGTHATFTREAADRWYRSRGHDTDRLDLAIATMEDDRCVGEAVITGLDVANRNCGFRISLLGPSVFGRGFGTEATRLILGHVFDRGVHRVDLEVYDFNPRAQRVYEQAGFVVEGVRREALLWEGEYHDAIVMGLLATEWRPEPDTSSDGPATSG